MFNTIRVLLITTLVSTFTFADVFMTLQIRKIHQTQDDMLSYIIAVIQL